MKKILYIIFFIPIVSFGQSSLGIKAGVSFSNADSPKPEYSTKIGPNIGFIYSLTLNNLQFTVEPSFNQKRIAYHSEHTIPNEKYLIILNYFELPITVGWMPFTKKILFGVNGGLAPTWALSGKAKDSSSSHVYTDLRRPNLDYIIGAKTGYRINDKSYVILNLRYGLQIFGYGKEHVFRYSYITAFFELGHRF